MKLMTVVGARPQFIKAAAFSSLAKKLGVDEIMVHTGQHYDQLMSEVFFSELGIAKAPYHLEIGSGSHGLQTGRMLAAIEALIDKEKPAALMVYGDTNSTLAGALAAVKMHVPVVHVEAGLRSFNRKMPEEMNRILTDQCSDLLFAPTKTAVDNLRREGFDESRIFNVGDIMVDSLKLFSEFSERYSDIRSRLGHKPQAYVLATVHRAENTDDLYRLKNIFEALAQLSLQVPVVLPLHPRTKKHLARLELSLPESLQIIEPVGYLDMLQLEKHAALVATDSGGVQKEAYLFGVPCVTLRDETEWVELLDSGWNRLASPAQKSDEILGHLLAGLVSQGEEAELYGDGQTARRILDILLSRPGA